MTGINKYKKGFTPYINFALRLRRKYAGARSCITGFTLLETLVSLSIFATIMIIVSTMFVAALGMQRRAMNLQLVEENASYILESMAKEIRVSKIAPPPIGGYGSCPATPSSSLYLLNQYGQVVVYSKSGTNVIRNISETPTTMNSDSVEITNFGFCVEGFDLDDGRQPRVTIFATIKSKRKKEEAVMQIQTTMSSRGLID